MAFEKIENADLIGKMIAELADVPELTADELKKRFDAASKDVIIPKFNKLIDALAAVSAASNIGMNPPEGITAEQNIAAVITAIAVSVKNNSDSRHTHSNKAVIDAITADAKKKYDDLVSLFSAIKTISNVVKDDSTLLPTGKAIVDYVEELGGGDMLKATYDSDNDGVVDNASKLGGQSPTYYQKASDDTLNTQNKTVVGAVNEVQEMMEALTEKMLTTKVLKLGKATTIAANALIDLTFTSTDKCIGQSGYNLNDRNLAGKVEITGIEPNGNAIRLFGRNIYSSAITISADAYVIALVVGSSSK